MTRSRCRNKRSHSHRLFLSSRSLFTSSFYVLPLIQLVIWDHDHVPVSHTLEPFNRMTKNIDQTLHQETFCVGWIFKASHEMRNIRAKHNNSTWTVRSFNCSCWCQVNSKLSPQPCRIPSQKCPWNKTFNWTLRNPSK